MTWALWLQLELGDPWFVTGWTADSADGAWRLMELWTGWGLTYHAAQVVRR